MHIPVLLQKTIDSLAIKPGDVFLDLTLGEGGHSEYVQKRFDGKVKLIGSDLDDDAITRAKEKISKAGGKITVVNENFRNIGNILKIAGVERVDKILLDLGFNSSQLENSGRGFSFQKNEPLLMSFSKDSSVGNFTAKEIANDWNEENIATILRVYGEEKFANKIARKIVERRSEKPIETTFDLRDIVIEAVPKFYRFRKIHPATKTFQAFRIAVNDELQSIRDALSKGLVYLSARGRIGVISFHSLEDRIVKNFFKENAKEGKGIIITKKPITPSAEEVAENPRSRSAKLRIFQKN